MAKQTAAEISKAVYKSSELIRCARGIKKDVLSAVLKPDRQYTEEQADELVKTFLEKEDK